MILLSECCRPINEMSCCGDVSSLQEDFRNLVQHVLPKHVFATHNLSKKIPREFERSSFLAQHNRSTIKRAVNFKCPASWNSPDAHSMF